MTNFREKCRESPEESEGAFFFQSSTDCIYSITDMLENTIGLIEPGKHIILHPSPDHMFDNNLFEVIVNSFLPGSAGTSFPHPQYLTIDDYENGIMYDQYSDNYQSRLFDYDPNKHIPETVYFDADDMLEKDWQDNFFKRRIVGTCPGIGIHLLLLTSARNLQNLIFKVRVHNIISHVDPRTNKLDMKNHLSESHKTPDDWEKNTEITLEFCKAQKVNKKIYEGTLLRSRKLVMLSRFKPIGNTLERLCYYLYLIKFTLFPLNEFVLLSKIKSVYKNVV